MDWDTPVTWIFKCKWGFWDWKIAGSWLVRKSLFGRYKVVTPASERPILQVNVIMDTYYDYYPCDYTIKGNKRYITKWVKAVD